MTKLTRGNMADWQNAAIAHAAAALSSMIEQQNQRYPTDTHRHCSGEHSIQIPEHAISRFKQGNRI